MSVTAPPPVVSLGDVGLVVCSTDVDLAWLSVLQTWMATYLRPMSGRVPTPKQLPRPRTFTNTVESAEWLDHQLPALVVETSSAIATQGGPNTFYMANWRTAVSCIVRGRRPPETRRLGSIFAAAMVTCIVQKGRVDGIVDDLRYQSLQLGAVPDGTGNGRYLIGATATFTAMTNVAVQGTPGPEIPDADTYVGDALVTEVDLAIAGETVSIGGSGGSP